MCYNRLQKKWLVWSKGYVVPIERTTLHGSKEYAAIAGQDLAEPVKEWDAIWHFFLKACGNSTELKFRAEQVELTLIIDYEDIARVEARKEEMDEAANAKLYIPTKVSGSNTILLMYRPLYLQ
jgi:hypothetical protein